MSEADDGIEQAIEIRLRELLAAARSRSRDDSEALRKRILAELDRATHDHRSADIEQLKSEDERADSRQLFAQANREDRRADEAQAAAKHEADPAERMRAQAASEQRRTVADAAREDGRMRYDSAERRAETARTLESRGLDRELVAIRMRADISQARPAVDAVRTGRPGRTAAHGRSYQARSMRQLPAKGRRTALSR